MMKKRKKMCMHPYQLHTTKKKKRTRKTPNSVKIIQWTCTAGVLFLTCLHSLSPLGWAVGSRNTPRGSQPQCLWWSSPAAINMVLFNTHALHGGVTKTSWNVCSLILKKSPVPWGNGEFLLKWQLVMTIKVYLSSVKTQQFHKSILVKQAPIKKKYHILRTTRRFVL